MGVITTCIIMKLKNTFSILLQIKMLIFTQNIAKLNICKPGTFYRTHGIIYSIFFLEYTAQIEEKLVFFPSKIRFETGS